MAIDDTSEIVVLQRIRNRIIEYLEAVAVPDNWSAAFSTPVELIDARIDELFPLEEWRNLASTARMTLQVFVVRGRFS